jgi:hypothetical protein
VNRVLVKTAHLGPEQSLELFKGVPASEASRKEDLVWGARCNRARVQPSTRATEHACNRARVQPSTRATEHACNRARVQPSTRATEHVCNRARVEPRRPRGGFGGSPPDNPLACPLLPQKSTLFALALRSRAPLPAPNVTRFCRRWFFRALLCARFARTYVSSCP